MGECRHGPVLLDREGLFLKICKLQRTTTASVVEPTKEHLAGHGVPVTVHSDGGPQFSSQELQTFDKEWEFEHTMSSPYNSHSIGRAVLENCVSYMHFCRQFLLTSCIHYLILCNLFELARDCCFCT